jgi:acetylornithine/LysW-gamma-L-lysine aminotransferase
VFISAKDDQKRSIMSIITGAETESTNPGVGRLSLSPPATSGGWVEDRYEIHLYNKREITLVRGEGVYIWDSDGRRYLDAMSNYGVNVLGHQHPRVNAAIIEQLQRLMSCHQSFYNDARAAFEEALIGILPPTLSRLSFANSGAEAVEAAIKYARAATGRQRIIAAKRSYHGRTMGALSVTADKKYRELFQPLVEECEHVAYDDLAALEASIDGAAAVILEPVQGESGVHVPSPGYLQAVRQLCNRFGVLLIFDEVQTGMGRTGRMFAFEHEAVVPDILTLSKGIANGLPMGVTVVSEAVAEAVPVGSHGSTFGGNPLVCAAATATIETLCVQDVPARVAELGRYFLEQLRALNHPLVREVRGRGFMIAVELKQRATPYLRALQEACVLAIPAGSTGIRFLPPLIMEREHVDEIVAALQRVLTARVEGGR